MTPKPSLFAQGLIPVQWLFAQGLIPVQWLFAQGLIPVQWLFAQGLIPAWLVALGCILASGAAISEPAQPTEPAPVAAATDGQGPDHGLEPLYGGTMVPLEHMPPGTNASPVPSDEIFPPQTITIRFNHRFHVEKDNPKTDAKEGMGQPCTVCHKAAYQSKSSADRLMPNPAATCDNCHDIDHTTRPPTAGSDANGQCTYCHLGQDAGKDGKVAHMVIPEPNLRMSHKAHLDRNIQCAQCHGMIEKLELATREQLPRMAGCFGCHNKPGQARGDARGECATCHLFEPNGRMRTEFSAGLLQPPMWLHGAAHGPDWILRHKLVAGGNSTLCGSCHESEHCTDCHDGKVRPRNVHPNDWISMHPQAARQDNPRCVSCHQLQSFCADCHRRVGVARDTPSANRLAGRRFHPPSQIWTTGPRSPQHHAFEAQRNLNACVSCHTERDCATCHATKGLMGGGGVNPHPLDFIAKCRTAFKRNPRPCLVCHTGIDPLLVQCR